jgi:sugar phosphate isomerase/epimerase
MHAPILIGSILLEANRWKPGKVPTYPVSEWRDRFVAAGFAGIELWENHALLSPAHEQSALASPDPLPTLVFNSYAGLENSTESASARALAADWCRRTAATGMKFNFGPDPARRDEYLAGARHWLSLLPPHTKMLCECHGGTIAEEPASARQLLDALGPNSRVGAIVHVMEAPERVAQWIHTLGPDRLTHAHVWIREPEWTLPDRFAALHAGGFRGSFTMEFTASARKPETPIESLWAECLHDLARVRQALAGLA